MARKPEKPNLIFVGRYQEDADFMYQFYQYVKKRYANVYRVFYDRITPFVTIEIFMALYVGLPKEIAEEISEYAYKLHISKHKNYWYTRYLFRLIGKMYFAKSYMKLRKREINHLFIYDDHPLINKAYVMAAKALKVHFTIIYKGYKKGLVFIDDVGTRLESSIPHNKEFYGTVTNHRHTTPSTKANIVVVLLQNDDDVDCILHAPIISKQSELLHLVTEVSQQLIKTQFIICGTKKQNTIHNIVYTKDGISTFLPQAKAIITINNYEALQALDFEIPIISFGDSFFNMEGITIVPHSKEEIVAVLESTGQHFNKKTACSFMNYVDSHSVAVHSLYKPSTKGFEDILHM